MGVAAEEIDGIVARNRAVIAAADRESNMAVRAGPRRRRLPIISRSLRRRRESRVEMLGLIRR